MSESNDALIVHPLFWVPMVFMLGVFCGGFIGALQIILVKKNSSPVIECEDAPMDCSKLSAEDRRAYGVAMSNCWSPACEEKMSNLFCEKPICVEVVK